jgi:hypothetical protein
MFRFTLILLVIKINFPHFEANFFICFFRNHIKIFNSNYIST